MTIKEATGDFLDRHWHSVPANYRGAFWMLLGSMLFISVQTLTKLIGGTIPSAEIAFFRALVGGVTIIPYLALNGLGAFRTRNLPLHLGRGAFGAGAIFLMVFAVIHMPIASATVIGFTRALFMIFLATIFLGEIVRWRRWTATLVGFAGVLLILRPGSGTFQLAALAALGAALCFALAHVCIKKCTARQDHPMTVQSYYWSTSTLLTLIPAIVMWVHPTLREFLILLAMGMLSGCAQVCVVYALRSGEATFVNPFDYTRLVWAALVGWFIFAEPLTMVTIVGATVIVGANLYLARSENRAGRAAAIKAAAAKAAEESEETA